MKFGKDFKKQMVPEWTNAYMDYNGLKRILGEIRVFKQSKQRLPSLTPTRNFHRRLTTLHCPSNRLNREQSSNLSENGDVEDQAIAVNTMQREGSIKRYKTEFLHQSDEGGENEVIFFRKLDEELNKVNSFYKDKVEEVMGEAASLDKQMDALIALRIKGEHFDSDGSSTTLRHSTDIATTLTSTSAVPNGVDTSRKEHMDLIPETDTGHDNQQEDSTEVVEVSPEHTANCGIVDTEQWNKNINDHKPDPLEILERVKINNTRETPMSIIKGVIKDSRDEELSFGKQELRKVEERLKVVFIEFYQKLCVLKHYSFMNLSAFAKIMKKYEKITARGASRAYMKIVDNSRIGGSDEVTGLMERVEATFVKHFSKLNRREGMRSLRPKVKREKHRITFFSGFFSGGFTALVIAVIVNIEARNLMDKKEGTLYMENIFPLYRQPTTTLISIYLSITTNTSFELLCPACVFAENWIDFHCSLYAYIVLHMLMYAGDIYFWRRYRVNYTFIFGFKQGTELGYREVFLLSSGLAVLALASFLGTLDLDMNSRCQSYRKYTKLVPLGLVIIVLVITFCPFNIIYRSSRFFLIHCTLRCLFAPLYKVTLPDFFLADNLASQVQAIRAFTLYICYYGLGEFSRGQSKCNKHGIYNVLYFVVALMPYWIRFLQCLRRLFEEKEAMHGYNGLKYFLTIVAVVIRTIFELKKGATWMVLALVSSAVATIMNAYWDIVVDWGLLRRHSKNFCLRDKLLISHHSVYFLSMVVNILLRLAWLQLVLEFNLRALNKMTASVIISCLEIIRRGIWNFFRLENEHLNNVGKYRAFKSVPLPFNYCDEDEDEDEDKDD